MPIAAKAIIDRGFRYRGFTLPELLIALLILGEIATFTIPKIISSQQNNSYNARAKEAAGMVAAAFQTYQMNNMSWSSMGIEDLTQYLNYVATDASSVIDDKQTGSSYTCGSSTAAKCIRLHSGAMLRYGKSSSYNMGGTATTNAIWFDIDPDGAYSGTTNGAGKAIEFWLYHNGRVSTFGNVTSNTCSNTNCVNPTPGYDPPWFSW